MNCAHFQWHNVFIWLNNYVVHCAESSGQYTTEHNYVDAVVLDNKNTQCNAILLDNIVLINTNHKPVYCNCFKVDSNYGVCKQ